MYNLITHRHSERKFSSKKISDADISKIIDAGLSAPSGMNTQPWHFTVIQNDQVKQELVNNCKIAFEKSGVDWRKNWATKDNFDPFYSPDIIVVISNNLAIEKSNEDCCFAIQNMVLMAESLGLSSCIIRDICWAIDQSNQAKYGIPEGYSCFMCISIGYATNKNTSAKILNKSKANIIK